MNTQPPPIPRQLNFVLCPGYHGATLLALLMNNHSRICALGDTNPTREFDQQCSCGNSVSKCTFWQEVSSRVGATRFEHCRELLPPVPLILSRTSVNRRLTILLSATALFVGPWVWGLTPRARDEYLEAYLQFHCAARELQGSSMLVDGLKDRVKALALTSLLGRSTRVKVIHLVRDPRGYLNSCYKYKNMTLEQSASLWFRVHRDVIRFCRPMFRVDYHRLHYEDLCAQPEVVMYRVFAFLGIDAEDVCRVQSPARVSHVIGNKMLSTFDGRIKLDTSWQERLPVEDQRRMLELTQPLSSRLGYV